MLFSSSGGDMMYLHVSLGHVQFQVLGAFICVREYVCNIDGVSLVGSIGAYSLWASFWYVLTGKASTSSSFFHG